MFLAFVLSNDHVLAVAMTMIIAYQTLNKLRHPQDTRFTDAFVIITPGITIKDRLNVLEPQEYRNYFKEKDIVSPPDLELLQQANVFADYIAYVVFQVFKNGNIELYKIVKHKIRKIYDICNKKYFTRSNPLKLST